MSFLRSHSKTSAVFPGIDDSDSVPLIEMRVAITIVLLVVLQVSVSVLFKRYGARPVPAADGVDGVDGAGDPDDGARAGAGAGRVPARVRPI